MGSLNHTLEIARRSLSTQQTAMNVTGHNIANALTKGYSRQRVDMTSAEPNRTSNGLLGAGVAISSLTRVRERFIDQQVRTAQQSQSNATMQQRILGQVESVFNEPSDGALSGVFGRFFNAIRNLSNNPEESSGRNEVMQEGVTLAKTFQRLNAQLSTLAKDLQNDVEAKLTRVNQLTSGISDLGAHIASIRAAGDNPNDAYDRMDVMIDELATLVPIQVYEDEQGAPMVSVNGTLVASRAGSSDLTFTASAAGIFIQEASSGRTLTIDAGEVGGVLRTTNTLLPSYRAKLNDVATALIQRFNQLHNAGYGLGSPAPTGQDFFSGSDASDIEVDPALIGNSNLLAASSTGNPGDNRTLLALAGVQDETLLNGGTMTVEDGYRGLISALGSDIRSAESTASAQDLVVQQLEAHRASVSGVSMDEEMTNLIKYQRSFDAAARLVTTVNDMYETLLNMV